jgi:hypothetical protein
MTAKKHYIKPPLPFDAKAYCTCLGLDMQSILRLKKQQEVHLKDGISEYLLDLLLEVD